MKIVHLCNYIPTKKMGYQEYFLPREHARMAHEVHIVTSERFNPFPEYESTTKRIIGHRIARAGESEEEGMRVHRLPVSLEYSGRVWLKGLEAKLIQIDPDYVICHSAFSFNAIRLMRMRGRLRSKFVYDEHVIHCWSRRDPVGRAGYLLFRLFYSKRVYDGAHAIVGVTDESVEFIKKVYGMRPDKIRMIPLGVDSSLFVKDRQAGSELKRKLRIDPDSKVIIYTGKLIESKSPHLIIEALNALSFPERKISVLFVGEAGDSYKNTFQSAVSSSRYPVYVHPAVLNEDMPRFFSAADIAVWPASATISIIEAMSCGLAVIYPDFLTELKRDGNGIPIKEWDTRGLADAIKKLVEDPSLADIMGAKARRFTESELDWKVIAKKFIE